MAITNQMVPNSGTSNNLFKPVTPENPVKPVTNKVNQETDTVQGQLKGLTSGSSAFVNLQENEAARQSNSRGLINSTIAKGEGREAAINSAIPIATPDAKTFSDTRTNNQNTENRFLENRQNTNLNMETDKNKSGLVRGEMALKSNLNNQENSLLNELSMKRDNNASSLSQAEQASLKELEMKRDAAQSGLNISEQNNQSGLTTEENRVLTELSIKRDNNASSLTQEEQDNLNALEIKRDNNSSALNIERDTNQSTLNKEEELQRSALTNEENQLLSDLTIKRDDNLSTLTQAEQDNLNELNMKRDASLHLFDTRRDNNSSLLNESLAMLESRLRESEMETDIDLRQKFEVHMNNEKFSDESQLQIVTTMNTIIRDTQQQIVDIGMSDRSAEQQASAVQLLQDNRDAQLAVYDDVLAGFTSWQWDTDFTPDRVDSPSAPTPPEDTSGGGSGGSGSSVGSGSPPSGEGTGGGRQ
jgi:hypothetical protein